MLGNSLSHYEILEELGRGGMGIVYRARDTRLERTVAIKVLPSGSISSPSDRQRLFREARAAASLQHPHIASVYQVDEAIPKPVLSVVAEEDSGESVSADASDAAATEAVPFIVMEYVEGLSLAECLTGRDMPLRTVAKLARQIAYGLSAAHEKGIVHRDIKTTNVMVTGKMDAKILDFGIARHEGLTRLTKEGSTFGTIAYMSPEQARGEPADFRTDIWSLGVVLYEMLTGQLPFRGVYEQAIIYLIMNGDPAPPSSLRTDLPVIFDFIIGKCLAKDPEDRYQSRRRSCGGSEVGRISLAFWRF